MRSISSSGNANLWHSPLPYLFSGLGLTLLLIAVALIILACSYRKSSSISSEQENDGGERPTLAVVDAEPKIVVIMAGDEKPTYLATPVIATSLYSCTCNHSLQQQLSLSVKEGADP